MVRSLVRFGRLALPLALVAVAPACASPEEEAEEGDAAFSAEDASCFDASPRAGESPTDARARCLTDYAGKLIDMHVARAESPRDAAIAAFKGKLRVSGDTGCFTEDIPGNFAGVWQNDIDSRRDVGMLAVQIKASIEFLKGYYRDLDGYPNRIFDQLDICPSKQIGGDLVLTGSRLRVGVRTGLGGRFGIHTSTALREKWTAGEHLESNALLASLVGGRRWAMLDPVGTPRILLRRLLRSYSSDLAGKLDALEGKPNTEVKEKLSALVRDQVLESVTDAKGKNLRARALAAIAAADGADLAAFRDKWKNEIGKPELLDGAEEGAITMQDVLNNKDVKVEVRQNGWVNISNFNEVNVDVDFMLPNGRSFSRFVEVEKSETNVTVEQNGTFNVQVTNVLNLRVRVMFGKTSQTASVDKVLDAVDGAPTAPSTWTPRPWWTLIAKDILP